MVMTEEQRKASRKESLRKYNASRQDAHSEYMKTNYKQLIVRFNVSSESDQIDYLFSHPDGASTHLKNLLKKEMEESLP